MPALARFGGGSVRGFRSLKGGLLPRPPLYASQYTFIQSVAVEAAAITIPSDIQENDVGVLIAAPANTGTPAAAMPNGDGSWESLHEATTTYFRNSVFAKTLKLSDAGLSVSLNSGDVTRRKVLLIFRPDTPNRRYLSQYGGSGIEETSGNPDPLSITPSSHTGAGIVVGTVRSTSGLSGISASGFSSTNKVDNGTPMRVYWDKRDHGVSYPEYTLDIGDSGNSNLIHIATVVPDRAPWTVSTSVFSETGGNLALAIPPETRAGDLILGFMCSAREGSSGQWDDVSSPNDLFRSTNRVNLRMISTTYDGIAASLNYHYSQSTFNLRGGLVTFENAVIDQMGENAWSSSAGSDISIPSITPSAGSVLYRFTASTDPTVNNMHSGNGWNWIAGSGVVTEGPAWSLHRYGVQRGGNTSGTGAFTNPGSGYVGGVYFSVKPAA